MLGSSPIHRLRSRVSARSLLLLVAGLAALGAACTEGRLPTQAGGLLPMPIRLTLNAQLSSAGRAIKVVARHAKQSDTLQLVTFDSATVTLTGTESQLPIKLDIAACLAAPDRERPAGMSGDLAATVCMLRLRVTLLDEIGGVIDESTLPPIVARPGEEAQAPPVSLGIVVGSVVVTPDSTTLNALTRTATLSSIVRDRQGVVITAPALSYTSLDPAIATVDTLGGRVTAVGVGTARIVATSRDRADTARVTVRQVPGVVRLTSTATSFFVGDSLRLSTAVQDSAGVTIPAPAAQLVVSDTAIASITPTGWVVGRRAGTVTITGTALPASGTLALTVATVPVASVSLSPSPDTIGIGLVGRLTATVTGTNGAVLTGRRIVWTSSDSTTVKVDTLGTVFGVNVGGATVTASTEGKSASVPVIVETALFCPDGRPRASATLRAAIVRTPANGTVLVCNGVHAVDTARIDRPLTLRSQNPGGATIESADQNVTAIQTGRPSVFVAGITAGTVRIADIGFRMKGRGLWLGDIGAAGGVYDQVVIDSARFAGTDTLFSIALTVGASTLATAHVDVTNSTLDNFAIGAFLISPVETFIRRSLFQNFSGGGVLFSGTYAQGRVEDNVFRNCGARNCVRGLLIGPYAVIARNRFEVTSGANKGPAIIAQRSLTTPARNPIIIEDNEIIGAATGADPLTAAGWTLQAGIFVNDSIGVENVVRGNRISGVHEGVLLRADARLTNNVVTGSGLAFNVNGTLITATIQRNDFTSLARSFASNSTRGSYQCNWWGTASGPASPPATLPSGMYTPVASQPIAGQPTVACTPVAASGTRLWTGALSADWLAPGNWSPAQVPTTGDTAVVNSGGTQPTITGAAAVGRLVVGPGAVVTANGGAVALGSLALAGQVTGTSTLSIRRGASTIAGTLANLQVQSTAQLSLTGPATVTGALSVTDTAALALGGRRLAAGSLVVSNVATVSMTTAADTLEVTAGAASFSSTAPGAYSAGVMRLAGDFYTNGTPFSVSGTRIVATGSVQQNWYVGNSTLAAVVLSNSSAAGGVQLASNGGLLTITGRLTQSGGVTNAYNVRVLGGVDLQGGRMAVLGTMDVQGGTIASAAGTTMDGTGTLILRDVTGTAAMSGAFSTQNLSLVVLPTVQVTLRPGLGYRNVTLAAGTHVTLTGALPMQVLAVQDSASMILGGQHLSATSLGVGGQGAVVMINAADSLEVTGGPANFAGRATNSLLSAGVMRLAGDFYSNGAPFTITGTRVVATGTTQQNWYLGNSTVADLLLANTSGAAGVQLASNGGTLQVTGSLTQASGISNVYGVQVGGNVAVTGGTMNVLGQLRLTAGRITSAAGTALAGSGTLLLADTSGTGGVGGAFTVANLTMFAAPRQGVTLRPGLGYGNVALTGGAAVALSGPSALGVLTVADSADITLNGRRLATAGTTVTGRATLTMTNAGDTLDVLAQPLNLATSTSLNGRLTAGLIRAAGDFYTSGATIVSTGTRVVAVGTTQQNWYVGGSTLRDVSLLNTSATNGVQLASNGGTLTLTGLLTQAGGNTNVYTVLAGGGVTLSSGVMNVLGTLDVGGGSITSGAGSTIAGSGTLVIRDSTGTSNLGGGFSANLAIVVPGAQNVGFKPGLAYAGVLLRGGARVTLTGPATMGVLTLQDSADVTLGGRRLAVAGLTTQGKSTIALTNAADTLDVGSQPLNVASSASLAGRLTAGVIRAQGDFYTSGAPFASTGTRIAATGTTQQNWYVGGSTFADLVLANTNATNGVQLASNGGTLQVNGTITQQSGQTNLYGITASNGFTLLGGSASVLTSLDLAGGRLSTAAGTAVTGSGTITLRDTSGTGGVNGTLTIPNLVYQLPYGQFMRLRDGLAYQNVSMFGKGQVRLTGTTTLTGAMVVNDTVLVALDGRRLTVASVQTSNSAVLEMVNAGDTLDVLSTASFYGGAEAGRLTAGVLRIGGNFNANPGVFASGGTLVVFNGSSSASWVTSGSTFQSLVIDAGNPATSTLTLGSGPSGTTTVNGSLTLQNGGLMNTWTTNVLQNLTFATGTRVVNNGVLTYGATYTNNSASYTGTPPVFTTP